MEYTVLKDHCCVEKGLHVGQGMGRQERKIEIVQERVDNELDLGVKTSGEMGGKREKLKDQESFHKGNKYILLRESKYRLHPCLLLANQKM